ncbi:hypothetical protein LP032_071 [Listeria phage LP-032]|uniref:Uncharacterized protein n=4 Tax=Homburgvirus TaxID=1921125 RepID=A0A059TA21_9CAUD|nr:hypothetical protein LP026_091 [Listeria phage LP-026]AHL18920.1 hypothetical protein LP032_071 [Listeria phage LP-032]AHN84785.1 hypothetical protein LP026_091 [Listeria phage LP-026]QDK04615.1 hypothetical protein FK481_0101 [Listeria phage LP-010]QDK04726.1 hypothetical protein FK482_0104 [Listeria phage LP-013]
MKRIYKMWIEPFVGVIVFFGAILVFGIEDPRTWWGWTLSFIFSIGYGYFVGRPMVYYFLFDSITLEFCKKEIIDQRTQIENYQEEIESRGKTIGDLTERVLNLFNSNKELLDRLEYLQKEAENLQEELLMLREENAQLIIQVKKHEE